MALLLGAITSTYITRDVTQTKHGVGFTIYNLKVSSMWKLLEVAKLVRNIRCWGLKVSLSRVLCKCYIIGSVQMIGENYRRVANTSWIEATEFQRKWSLYELMNEIKS